MVSRVFSSVVKVHHHHSHHNHRHYDKHYGVDRLCNFLLVCAKGPCFLLPAPETNRFPTLKAVASYIIGRLPQQYYGGGSDVRPVRESALGDRTSQLPRHCRLLQETGSRGVSYAAGVYHYHYGIRSFQTAVHICCDVETGSGILQSYWSSSSNGLLTSARAMETPSPPKLLYKHTVVNGERKILTNGGH